MQNYKWPTALKRVEIEREGREGEGGRVGIGEVVEILVKFFTKKNYP